MCENLYIHSLCRCPSALHAPSNTFCLYCHYTNKIFLGAIFYSIHCMPCTCSLVLILMVVHSNVFPFSLLLQHNIEHVCNDVTLLACFPSFSLLPFHCLAVYASFGNILFPKYTKHRSCELFERKAAIDVWCLVEDIFDWLCAVLAQSGPTSPHASIT